MSEQRQIFTYKLDVYYQAIVIYAVTLVAYAVVVGFAGNSFEHVWRDQVVYLLAFCAVASLVGLLAAMIAGRKIEIDDAHIVLSSRFHRREILVADVVWIRIGKEKRMKVRGVYRVAKLKLRNRRKLLRLRPSLFMPEDRLVDALRHIDVQAHRNSHGTQHA